MESNMKTPLALALLTAPLLAACESTTYGIYERLGVHKRDILVDRVEEGRDAQHAAKEQFQSALDAFRQVADYDGGELEELYDRLRKEYERSDQRVSKVRGRIDAIEDVAEDLFDEWKDELDEIQSDELRDKSEQTLRATRERYEGLIDAMRRAEGKMTPVLAAFRDHVLYLKHNLNAAAIASLDSELASIESDITMLIGDMEASIAEADAFIATMEGS
jgi:chromosome segregation ATPase